MKIYLFHRIHPQRDPMWDPMSPKLFEKLIVHLKKKYTLILLEDYLKHPAAFVPHKKYASIVFDDGYKDYLDYAFPILSKYKVPSSIYVVTDSITHQKPIWTYEFDYLFFNTNELSARIGDEKYQWNNKEERIRFAQKLKPSLKKLNHQNREEKIKGIRNSFPDISVPKNLFLTWKNIKELHNNGVVIGSHTVNHPLLGKIEDKKIIYQELIESGQTIAQHTGTFPDCISYPNGSFSKEVKELAKKAGYNYGLAVKNKSFNPIQDDYFEIPRIELYNESFSKTKLRSTGIITTLKSILRK